MRHRALLCVGSLSVLLLGRFVSPNGLFGRPWIPWIAQQYAQRPVQHTSPRPVVPPPVGQAHGRENGVPQQPSPTNEAFVNDPSNQALVNDAIRWSSDAIRGTGAAPGPAANGRPGSAFIHSSWNLAHELVSSVKTRRRPRLWPRVAVEISIGRSRGNEADHPLADRRQDGANTLSHQRGPSPHRSLHGACPLGHSPNTSCLLGMAIGVPVWDAEAAQHVPPGLKQLPQGDDGRLYGEAAIAAHGILSSLTAAAVATVELTLPNQQRVQQQAQLRLQIRSGHTLEAGAEQRRQFASLVLAPLTRARAYRSCFGQGRCGDVSGVCEWCGARVCCYAHAPNDSAACGRQGGWWRHVCSTPPSGSATAVLDTLVPFARPRLHNTSQKAPLSPAASRNTLSPARPGRDRAHLFRLVNRM